MGPQKPEKFEVAKFERVLGTIKRAQEAYFKDPVHYLFYGSLTLVIVTLFFNYKLPWQLYGILTILCGVKVYQYLKSSWQANKK